MAIFYYFNHTFTLSTILNSLIDPDGRMTCLWCSQYFLLNKLKYVYSFSAVTGSSLTVTLFTIFYACALFLILHHSKYIRNMEKWKEISPAKVNSLQRHPRWQGIWPQNSEHKLEKASSNNFRVEFSPILFIFKPFVHIFLYNFHITLFIIEIAFQYMSNQNNYYKLFGTVRHVGLSFQFSSKSI